MRHSLEHRDIIPSCTIHKTLLYTAHFTILFYYPYYAQNNIRTSTFYSHFTVLLLELILIN